MDSDKAIPVKEQPPHIPQAYLLRFFETDLRQPYRLCRLKIEAEKTLREQSAKWPPSKDMLKPEDFHPPQFGAQYDAKKIIYRIQTSAILEDVVVPESKGLLEFIIDNHNALVKKVRDLKVYSYDVQALIDQEYEVFLKNPDKYKAAAEKPKASAK